LSWSEVQISNANPALGAPLALYFNGIVLMLAVSPFLTLVTWTLNPSNLMLSLSLVNLVGVNWSYNYVSWAPLNAVVTF